MALVTAPSRTGWRIVAVVVTVAALGILRAGSLATLRTADDDSGLLRLSWSARPERIERCRRLSDAELAARPAHMRMRWECEGQFATYLMEVRIDGLATAIDTVRGGGLRHDRSMHVFREYRLAAGARRLEVMLTRIESDARPDTAEATAVAAGSAAANRETREAQERRTRRAESLAAHLRFDTTLVVPPRGVMLVTYVVDERRLALRAAR